MANPEHLVRLKEGVEAWNEWRASQSVAPDLSGANLRDESLIGRNLVDADLKGADLNDSILGDANLRNADLRGADLRRATFDNANLSGASLREANLQCVDLSVAQRGLQTEQLAGADLTGATLPPELTKMYDSLDNVNNISESARKLVLAVLSACLYSWLTIATTTDVNLITNRASSPLPIIQTSIPIVGFYWIAPLLLLCVYFYFHFYLQKLWEELGSLPAIFPDGRPLHTKIDPWLLNDLVRAHLPKLNINRPFLPYLQLWISVLLAWWVVPITMFLFWGRYLPRHEQSGTTFHVALLVVSLTAGLCLYRLAVATLRGTERRAFRWKGMVTSRRGFRTTAFAVAVGVFFGLVSWGARWGVPSNVPIFGIPLRLQRNSYGRLQRDALGARWGDAGWNEATPLTWVPRLMALVGYSPFADLTGAEVSQKKPTWSRNGGDLATVVGAQLKGMNLRYAVAPGVFLAGAHLEGVDLSGADLTEANFHGAVLKSVDLNRAFLDSADLSGADLFSGQHPSKLTKAELMDADLSNATLDWVSLRGANLTRAKLTLASLEDANLAYATLDNADLSRARLKGANLFGSRLSGSKLGGAEFEYADVTYADFREATDLILGNVKGALNSNKALYDNPTALGLPSDNNDRIAKEWIREELQQK